MKRVLVLGGPWFLLVSFVVVNLVWSQAGSGELGHCASNDAVCVGRVLLDEIRHRCDGSAGRPRHGGRAASTRVEYFTGARCGGNLLASVSFGPELTDNGAACERLSQFSYVRSVRTNGGDCLDTELTNLREACGRYR